MDNNVHLYDGDIRPIDSIEFNVWGNKEIKRQSVVSVEITEPYDNMEPKRGGVIDTRLGVTSNMICSTCGFDTINCIGHFGHIDLGEPVFHMGFLKFVKKILSNICIRCSKLLIYKNEDQIIEMLKNKSTRARFNEIKNITKNITHCIKPGHGCGTPVTKIKIESKKQECSIQIVSEMVVETIGENGEKIKKIIKIPMTPDICFDILKNISDSDAKIMGIDHLKYRPEDMIHKLYPVSPVPVRPSVKADFMESSSKEDDLTTKLIEIVKANNRIRKSKDATTNRNTKYGVNDVHLLQFQICTNFDNESSIMPRSEMRNKPTQSLSSRLKKKEGRIRGNLMGKRVDFCGRTVITGDPTIDINELRVPYKIAKNLTIPEVVTHNNIQKLAKLVKNGTDIYPGANFVWNFDENTGRTRGRYLKFGKDRINLKYGDVVERHLIDGDMVLLNRQPSLHKLSMMAHKVKVIQDPNINTYGLNIAATTPYNADFDGDEMNIFVPQSNQTKIELSELANLEKQIIKAGNSLPVVGIVNDGMIGAYNLSSPDTKIHWKSAMNIISYTSFKKFHLMKKEKDYGGNELFSLIIPGKINMSGDLNVKNGVITSGKLGSAVLGPGRLHGIIHNIWEIYGSKETRKFIDNTQKLINNFNLSYGFTCGIGDTKISEKIIKEINVNIQTKLLEIDHMITELENNTDIIDADTLEMSVHAELGVFAPNMSKLVIANLAKDNNFMSQIVSGSKGKELHLSQMIACVGQTSLDNKRVKKRFHGRSLAYFHQGDDSALARGFIPNPLGTGLKPTEYIFHAMGSREGVLDTAIKSVTWETPIIIIENGNSKRVLIGEWVDELMDKNPKNVKRYPEDNNLQVLRLKNVYIPTADKKGVSSWGDLIAVTRHDPSGTLYKIKTQSGREVTVAESKSMIIWDETKNQFLPKHTPDVKIGDCTPVVYNLPKPPVVKEYIDMNDYYPRTKYIYGTDMIKAYGMLKEVDFTPKRGWWGEHNGKDFTLPYKFAWQLLKNFKRKDTKSTNSIDDYKTGYIYPLLGKRNNTQFPEKLDLDYDNGFFIGLYIADGDSNVGDGHIRVSKNDKLIQDKVEAWFDKFNIKHQTYRKTNDMGYSDSVRGFSVMWARFFLETCGHCAKNKKVPNESFMANDDFVSGLIDGYLSGDGCVSQDGKMIVAGSASERLIEEMGTLLFRFGIFSSKRSSQLKKNNLGTKNISRTYKLNIGGLWVDKFIDLLKITHPKKNGRLKNKKSSKNASMYKTQKGCIKDKIVSIEKVKPKDPYLYDVTVPKTSYFGIGNGIVQKNTAETGYIQRRLVKCLEDLLVTYDGTVRNANNYILQFSYSDNGHNNLKQSKNKLYLLELDNKELGQKIKFTNDELKTYKNFSSKDNENHYLTVLKMRDKIRKYRLQTMIDNMTFDSSFVLPVNFTLIIQGIGYQNIKSDQKLEPDYILEKIHDILHYKNTKNMCMTTETFNKKSLKYEHEMLSKFIFRFALYQYLSPKVCLKDHRLNKKEFDTICEQIIKMYNKAMAEPGDMVGITAAQSMGEPATQMSCHKDTLVLINDDKNNVYYGPVGPFINKLLDQDKEHTITFGKKNQVLDINRLGGDHKYYIVGASNNEKVVWKQISQVSKHPANGNLVKVYTKSGRSTTATLSHSFLIRTSSGITPIKGSQLKVGHRIPVARQIPILDNCLNNVTVNEHQYELSYKLGYICGQGVNSGYHNSGIFSLRVPNKNNNKLCEYLNEMEIENSLDIKKNYTIVSITDAKINKLISEHFVVGKSRGVLNKIPEFVFVSNIDYIVGLLDGIFEHNDMTQTIHSDNKMRFESDNELLITQIITLLLFTGVYSIKKRFRNKYCVEIQYNSGKSFSDFKGTISSTYDIIPGTNKLVIYGLSLIDMDIKAKHDIYSKLTIRELSRSDIEKYISLFENTIEQLKEKSNELPEIKDLCEIVNKLNVGYNSCIIWDDIVELKEIGNYSDYVYDFTVPGTESFMVDEGIIVHNTLNTFHTAGAGSSAMMGVPRVNDLLRLAKAIKTPGMTIHMEKGYENNLAVVNKVQSNLKYITLNDVKNKLEIYYEPDIFGPDSYMKKDDVQNVFYKHNPKKTSCQTDISDMPWLVRIHINKEKMMEKDVTLLDIKTIFCNNWEKKHNMNKGFSNEEKAIADKITKLAILSNYDNSPESIIHIRFDIIDFDFQILVSFIDIFIDNFKLKGMRNIVGIDNIKVEPVVKFDKNTGEMLREKQYVIYSNGINMVDIRYLNGIDLNRVTCNDVMVTYRLFGIDAMRNVIRKSFKQVFDMVSEVNDSHLQLLADFMTSSGIPISIDRHGMKKLDIDPLARVSFEKPVEEFINAATFCDTDKMNSVSSRIMAGLVIKGGTGIPNIILDTDLLENSEYIQGVDEVDKDANLLSTNNVISDVINQNIEGIFVPN